jgi:hypothetical protein
MKLTIDDLRINSLQGDPNVLWTKPEIAGYANVDLADPSLRFLQPNRTAQVLPTGPAPIAASPSIDQAPPRGKFSLFGWFQ